MKLVAVTENGQTKILPMAEPNWEQLWGTGPYWGQKDVPVAPVTQEMIGTTPHAPVYVRIDGGVGVAPYLTILGALIAATVGAGLAHWWSTRRDAETRERDERHATREALRKVADALADPELAEAVNHPLDARPTLQAKALSLTALSGETAWPLRVRDPETYHRLLNTAETMLDLVLEQSRQAELEEDQRSPAGVYELAYFASVLIGKAQKCATFGLMQDARRGERDHAGFELERDEEPMVGRLTEIA